MRKANLKDIYGIDEKHIEIKVSDLRNDLTKENDILSIKTLALKLHKKYKKQLILVIIINLLTMFSLVDFIKISKNIFRKEFFLIFFVFISFLYILLTLIYKVISTNDGSFKKSQYGIVNNKFCKKELVNNKVKTYYYAKVIFPNNNTFIRKVKCNKFVYDAISINTNVLVISFDNKSSYVILTTP